MLNLNVDSKPSIEKLRWIMSKLRDPQTGCPWDIKQSFTSITAHTIEEAYEVVDAIEQQDFTELNKELGDLLFQVIFYSQLGQEQQLFDFDSVVDSICEKLIRRHPHVF
ncbi:MAG: nucleoside triphosphate pyrophosphohydrolase, partial [Colwellia sp.]|nr:nucleoside triphosphate pyrophosphohydrolase [Colwellia sp.]